MFGPSKRQLYRDLTRQREHYERVIAELLDRIAHSEGRPWTAPPADPITPAELEARWSAAPEQDLVL